MAIGHILVQQAFPGSHQNSIKPVRHPRCAVRHDFAKLNDPRGAPDGISVAVSVAECDTIIFVFMTRFRR
jgi:hypothetical protein